MKFCVIILYNNKAGSINVYKVKIRKGQKKHLECSELAERGSEKVRRSIWSVLNWQREDQKRSGEAFGVF